MSDLGEAFMAAAAAARQIADKLRAQADEYAGREHDLRVSQSIGARLVGIRLIEMADQADRPILKHLVQHDQELTVCCRQVATEVAGNDILTVYPGHVTCPGEQPTPATAPYMERPERLCTDHSGAPFGGPKSQCPACLICVGCLKEVQSVSCDGLCAGCTGEPHEGSAVTAPSLAQDGGDVR